MRVLAVVSLLIVGAVAAPEKEGLLSDLFRGDSANRAGTLATFQGVLSFEPCTAISNPEASCATPECLIPGAYNAAIGQAFCGVSEKATCQEQGAELVGCNCIVFGIGGLSRPSYWEVEINFAVIEQDLCVCIGTNSRPLPTDGSQDATLVAVPTCAKVEPPPSKWGKARVVDAGVEAGEAGEAAFDTGAGAPVDGKKVGAKSASDTDKLMEIVNKLKAATGKSAKKAAAPAKKP